MTKPKKLTLFPSAFSPTGGVSERPRFPFFPQVKQKSPNTLAAFEEMEIEETPAEGGRAVPGQAGWP